MAIEDQRFPEIETLDFINQISLPLQFEFRKNQRISKTSVNKFNQNFWKETIELISCFIFAFIHKGHRDPKSQSLTTFTTKSECIALPLKVILGELRPLQNHFKSNRDK